LKDVGVSMGDEDVDTLLEHARHEPLYAQRAQEYQQYIEIMSWIRNIQEDYKTNAGIEGELVSQGINDLLGSMSKLSSQYSVSYVVKYF
jgi:hypothetical protein